HFELRVSDHWFALHAPVQAQGGKENPGPCGRFILRIEQHGTEGDKAEGGSCRAQAHRWKEGGGDTVRTREGAAKRCAKGDEARPCASRELASQAEGAEIRQGRVCLVGGRSTEGAQCG